MSELGKLLRELRGKKPLRAVGEETGLSHSYIADIEKGFRRGSKTPINPSADTLKRLSKAYDYPYEELLKIAGYLSEDDAPTIHAEKDELDIAKRMEKIHKDLSKEDGLLFNGEPLSDAAVESLMEAMEHVVRQTQIINKKFIPKKYRDKDKE
jgi:transcriptional regulator with XRE-family HTH domain